MAGRNESKADGLGIGGNGTVEPFAIPDRGTDSNDNGANVGGIPIESTEPERTKRDGSPRRKPGRKPGWNAGNAETKADRRGLPSLEITAGALKGVHDLASVLLKIDELELDDTEAEKLASALLALAKYYPNVDVPGKYIAWMNLLTTMGIVYSPKVATYKIRRTRERSQKLTNRPIPVAHAN